jgi:hypothetical protein
MARLASMSRTHMAVVLTAALSAFSFALNPSIAQQEDRPAFVICRAGCDHGRRIDSTGICQAGS